ncbi:MAG: hypothetical protein U1F33_18025 [Alphaproteobacteria bacterium]
MAERPKRFFVTIEAPDRHRLREVFGRDLDLFAARSDESGHKVDGLISLDDVRKLVEAGYKVQVSESAEPRRRPRFIGAQEWMKGMESELKPQRKRKRR